ncbi:MAG: ABC transporter substrate-binding protein [Frankiaceae bacterium]|nr:ABC transporter substrate-binding protein [Frankiaceae bacterium]
MRKTPVVPLLLASALLLTACGARLDDETRRAAAAGTLAQAGAGDGSGATTGAVGEGTTGDAGSTTGVVGSGTTTGGSSGTAGTSGTTGSTGTAGSTTGGAPAPAGGNGGAVDVGVTENSILLGNVSDLSGPVPGLFQGAVIGTQAYLAKINSEGGVYGRQLKLKVGDGQLQCDENTRQHEALVPKVFAFVGSFSLYDGCGADVLKKNPGVPDVHNALEKKALDLPNNFAVAPLAPGWRTGPLLDYKKKYPDKWNAIGTIYANPGGGAATWRGCKAAIEALGGKVLYERGFEAVETDFTADIVSMQRAGVKMVYVIASDAPTYARIVSAAKQQGVDWPMLAGGIAYDEGFISRAGAASEGVYNDQQFAMFFNKDEADRVPAVKDFQTWTNKVAPGEKLDLFAVFGWSSAHLFVKALLAAGPKAKRADILAQLKKITSFDADGMIAPANPAGKKPPTCWLGAQVKGGKWVRITPDKGFRCDGPYYYFKG